MEEANNSTVKKTTVNGVDIIEDGDVTHFVISEDESPKIEESKNNKDSGKKESFFTKLKNWMKNSNFRLYAKVRDFADPFGDRINDPFDYDAGCDGAKGAEIGIKFDF